MILCKYIQFMRGLKIFFKFWNKGFESSNQIAAEFCINNEISINGRFKQFSYHADSFEFSYSIN